MQSFFRRLHYIEAKTGIKRTSKDNEQQAMTTAWAFNRHAYVCVCVAYAYYSNRHSDIT